MNQERKLCRNTVSDDERVARLVLSPSNVEGETGFPLAAFISLRRNEKGVSFLRFDFVGRDAIMKRGKQRETSYNLSHEDKNTFVGWLQGVAGNIKAINPQVIDIVVNNPEKKPEHVEIRFHKDGGLVKGIVTDAQILDILDEIFHSLEYVTV